jgi:hypothetical protein
MVRPCPHVKALWGGTVRHCADHNAGAQMYPFFGSFSDIWRSRHSASPDVDTQVQKDPVGGVIRSREDHSDEKITHHEVGWSPLRNHPINVRGGQVSDWEESQMLAALAVSELPEGLQ